MKENEKNLEKQIKEENENFIQQKEVIIQQKKEQMRQIEIVKRNRIKEDNEKYKNLLSYLDKIKNDKQKIIEFFQSQIII